MRIILFLILNISLFTTLNAQNEKPNYNAALADSLGADEYGMKHYFLIILKTGTAKIEDKTIVNQLFKGHLENIGKLAKEGKLVVAGPIEKNINQYRGIFIFNVKTKEEAEEILQTDPAIKANLLAADIYKWYGSAALPLYLQHHETLQKTKM